MPKCHTTKENLDASALARIFHSAISFLGGSGLLDGKTHSPSIIWAPWNAFGVAGSKISILSPFLKTPPA
jgi:hypothetical protein